MDAASSVPLRTYEGPRAKRARLNAKTRMQGASGGVLLNPTLSPAIVHIAPNLSITATAGDCVATGDAPAMASRPSPASITPSSSTTASPANFSAVADAPVVASARSPIRQLARQASTDSGLSFQSPEPTTRTALELVTPSRPLPPASRNAKSDVVEKALPRHPNMWNLERELGKGHFSRVWFAVHKETGDEHAVKIVDKDVSLKFRRTKKSELSLVSEQQLLSSLNHPNIVKIFDWIETEDQHYLVLEYVPGPDLLRCLQAGGRFRELQSKRLFRQLCEAVAYLHGQSVVHRDLKPENVLLTDSNRDRADVKLADLGISRITRKSHDCRTFCGTLQYSAPEVIKTLAFLSAKRLQATGYGRQADMWSLGVILYVVLSGVEPFDDEDKELPKWIIMGSWSFEAHAFAWRDVSSAAKDLVRALMVVDPKLRADTQQALQSKWLVSGSSETPPD